MGAAIITGMNAAPILEPAEHVLDLVTLTIERSVVFDRDPTIGFRRDTGLDAARGKGLAKPIGIIALVAEEFLGVGQGGKHQGRALVVAHLAFAEEHDQRPPLTVAHRMQFRVQAALGAPDTTGNSPFFKRLAAVRWAFRWVASIISRHGLPA